MPEFIPEYLISPNRGWLQLIWPMMLFVFLTALALWTGCFHLTTRGERQSIFWATFGFSALGMTVGVLAGDSGATVLGSVLPATLSIIGGIAAFLIAGQAAQRLLTAICIGGLSISLLLGALIGMENRRIEDAKLPRKAVLANEIEEPGKFRKDIEGLIDKP